MMPCGNIESTQMPVNYPSLCRASSCVSIDFEELEDKPPLLSLSLHSNERENFFRDNYCLKQGSLEQSILYDDLSAHSSDSSGFYELYNNNSSSVTSASTCLSSLASKSTLIRANQQLCAFPGYNNPDCISSVKFKSSCDYLPSRNSGNVAAINAITDSMSHSNFHIGNNNRTDLNKITSQINNDDPWSFNDSNREYNYARNSSLPRLTTYRNRSLRNKNHNRNILFNEYSSDDSAHAVTFDGRTIVPHRVKSSLRSALANSSKRAPLTAALSLPSTPDAMRRFHQDHTNDSDLVPRPFADRCHNLQQYEVQQRPQPSTSCLPDDKYAVLPSVQSRRYSRSPYKQEQEMALPRCDQQDSTKQRQTVCAQNSNPNFSDGFDSKTAPPLGNVANLQSSKFYSECQVPNRSDHQQPTCHSSIASGRDIQQTQVVSPLRCHRSHTLPASLTPSPTASSDITPLAPPTHVGIVTHNDAPHLSDSLVDSCFVSSQSQTALAQPQPSSSGQALVQHQKVTRPYRAASQASYMSDRLQSGHYYCAQQQNSSQTTTHIHKTRINQNPLDDINLQDFSRTISSYAQYEGDHNGGKTVATLGTDSASNGTDQQQQHQGHNPGSSSTGYLYNNNSSVIQPSHQPAASEGDSDRWIQQQQSPCGRQQRNFSSGRDRPRQNNEHADEMLSQSKASMRVRMYSPERPRSMSHRSSPRWIRISKLVITPFVLLFVVFIVLSPLIHFLVNTRHFKT